MSAGIEIRETDKDVYGTVIHVLISSGHPRRALLFFVPRQ